MARLPMATLAALIFSAVAVFAQEAAEAAAGNIADGGPDASPNLQVRISTSFPQSEIFGVKLINGRPTEALLSVENQEPDPVLLGYVGGVLWGPDPKNPLEGDTSVIVRNLTSKSFQKQIPAGEKESFSYKFATELHPQELRLELITILASKAGKQFQVATFNDTVAVVEPDASIFDVQLIFLYLMLAAVFAASSYFIYNTYIATMFPQKARGGKGGERAKKSSHGQKRIDPNDQVAVVGADGPAVTSASRAYDESWIPEHHMNRPEARRLKSGGRPKGSKGKGE